MVISGLQAGVVDSFATWAPVAAAFKLNEADFAQHVVAALPLIVRQHLDQAAADRLVQQLQAMKIAALVVPDDDQLVYLMRAGTTRGPLPLSALDLFVQPGESYRLRDSQQWLGCAAASQPPAPILPTVTPTSTPADAVLPEAAVPPLPIAVSSGPPPAPNVIGAAAMEPDNFLEQPPPLPAAPAATPPPLDSLAAHQDIPPPLPPPFSDAAEAPYTGPMFAPKHTQPSALGDDIGMRILLPVGRSGLAIAAGYLGLFAVIPFIAPITLLVSVLAWRDLRRHPEKYGRGRTIFGLVMGGLITVVTTVVLAKSFLFTPHQASPQATPAVATEANARSKRPPPSAAPIVATAAPAEGSTTSSSPPTMVSPAVASSVTTAPPPTAAADVAFAGSVATAAGAAIATSVGSDSSTDSLSASALPDAMQAAPAATTASPISSEGASIASTVNGPSFDCKLARSVTDVMICADGTLSKLDLEQAQVYRHAMSQASPENARILKDAQRQWLRMRMQTCGADKACIQRQFNDRIAELQQQYPTSVGINPHEP